MIDTPTLRPDGSIFSQVGFDAKTGLFNRGSFHISIPDSSGWNDESKAKAAAHDALSELSLLISKYRFASVEDRSVALAMFLSPFVVHAGCKIPLFAIDGSGPGVGKGLLVDTMATIAYGSDAPTVPYMKNEEFKKHMDSLLMEGVSIINLDNVEQPIGGDYLCTLFTQSVKSVRVLGISKQLRVEPRIMVVATGNNLVIDGDMARRTLKCRIDPQVERPELERFPFNPVQLARKERAKYAEAVLTILASHAAAGYPGKRLLNSTFGSFEKWSDIVRAALVWLGEVDPLLTMNALRESDPTTSGLERVVHAIYALVGEGKNFKPKELLDRIASTVMDETERAKVGELNDALNEVVQDGQKAKEVDSVALGKYLRRFKGRIVGGLSVIIPKKDKSRGNSYCIKRHGTSTPEG